jgi:dipeptidyl-peptidase 4
MPRISALLVVCFLFLAPGSATAQRAAPSDEANYRLAARWAPYKVQHLLYSTSVNPRWIEGSEQFWYDWKTADGTTYYIVDPARRTRRALFDNDRLAAELTRITRDPWDRQNLPIRAIRFIDANTLRFEVQSSQDEERKTEIEDDQEEQQQRSTRRRAQQKKVYHFEYDVRTQTLRELTEREEPDNHPSWAAVSPDGRRVVFARHDNLYMIGQDDYARILDARRGKQGAEADSAEVKVEVTEIQLTTDGEEFYSYAATERGRTDEQLRKDSDKRKRANISWSHDGTRFAILRFDQRKVGDLWVIHSVGHRRPQLESYKYDMPGEETVTQTELLIYDIPARTMVTVNADAFKDQRLGLFSARQFIYPDSNEPRRSLWLSEDPHRVHFWRRSRDQHRLDVAVADARTGEVTVIIEERLNTYVEHNRLELLQNGDMIWWSERDGWAHLYRFGPDGTKKNRLTEGPWSVRGIEGIDEQRGVVFFTANGREDGEDPYYQHLYRVNLDGSRLQLLNPGDYDHRVSMGKSNRFFVNNYSRVNAAPASALYEAGGRRIMDLETADFSRLTETGYRFPEPFTVKAADNVTDLYGVIYKPFDFDPNRSYPIIAYVYPGPQTEAVSKSFSTNATEVALAQFGFIVITVGNRGGHPARSKWYHNYGYGNLRDYGLADKKVAIEQLAARHPFIDMDRVGIYGHSGGGFMSTAAMLVYPDFFKVAVASAGNHNNDIYNQNWSEKHHGIRETVNDAGEVKFLYDIEKNSDLAANLKGRLLLTTGDVDNNVHPAGTIRMAEALIRANKRFDFFLYPGQRHGYGNMSNYWFWQRAEYFVRHLLGDDRWNADITELNVEREQTRGR